MKQEAMMTTLISQGVDRAKLGEARAVYEEVKANGGSIPGRSHYAFGWIIYYALHQAGDPDIAWRKRLLAEYLSLQTPRPHKLHSMILTEAIRLRDNVVKADGYLQRTYSAATESFSIVRFLPHWGIENLRPGDWNRHIFEDKKLSSTVEKLITIYVGEIDKSKLEPSVEFLALIDKAMEEYPDSYNLLFQRALLFSNSKNREQAKELLKRALMMAPGKFHIWSRLASMVDIVEDPRLRMALYARALAAPGKAEFKGRIRLELAEIWIAQNLFPQAVSELAEVKKLYDSQQWHLPHLYTELVEKIPTSIQAIDPSPTYSKLQKNADDYVFSCLPEISATKTYHKNPQPSSTPTKYKNTSHPSWRVTDASGNNYWFQPLRYGIDPNLPLGTPLFIRVLNGKLVYASLVTEGRHSLIK